MLDWSMETRHLKDPFVLYRSEGSALTLLLFLLSPSIIKLCSSTMTKDHFLIILFGTKWPLCADVPLNPYSFSPE